MPKLPENPLTNEASPAPPEDLRSPLAIGLAWSSTISGIALQAILPSLIGLWIDRKLGTVLLFFFLGLVLGMTSAVIQLLRLVKK